MRNQPTKRPPQRLWNIASCVISICVLIWMLSLPFRRSVVALTPADQRGEAGTVQRLDIVEKIQQKDLEDERYREEALMLDEELMRSLAQSQQQRQQVKPGIEHAREYRQTYKRRIKREIEQLGRPPEQSPQWHYQQELLKQLRSDDDGPM